MTDLLTPQDAAKLLGVSAQRVRQMEAQGRLSSIRTAGGWRLFQREDVLRLAVERAQARAARQADQGDAA
jgi:excisionase family DNA binding protein